MLIIYEARLRRAVLGGRCYETKHGGKSDQDGGAAEEVLLLVYENPSHYNPSEGSILLGSFAWV